MKDEPDVDKEDTHLNPDDGEELLFDFEGFDEDAYETDWIVEEEGDDATINEELRG